MSNILDRERRALVLWKDLRIVVIDTKTTGSTDGDRVMLAGHHIPFDISRLRAELRRTGHDLPNYQLLDTIHMAVVAEVQGKDKKLSTLLELLHLTNTNPHDALGDAMATTQALIELINRGINAGMTSIGGVAGWSGGRFPIKTAHGVRPAATGKDTSDEARLDPSLASAHIDLHAIRHRKWTEWVEVLDECQSLACSRAQVAVLVNAIADVLNHYGDRDSAKRIYRHYARRLDALGKCDLDDAASPCCRYCAAKQPCPVDT